MTTNIDKNTILDALELHISQRSGIDARNYFSSWADKDGVAAFRSEYRQILRDGKEARILLRAVRNSVTIIADEILAATKQAFSGRLSWNPKAQCFNYCTGQYFPTEYRCAACVVLASVLWNWSERPTGDDKRQYFRREFGRGIQSRWFN